MNRGFRPATYLLLVLFLLFPLLLLAVPIGHELFRLNCFLPSGAEMLSHTTDHLVSERSPPHSLSSTALISDTSPLWYMWPPYGRVSYAGRSSLGPSILGFFPGWFLGLFLDGPFQAFNMTGGEKIWLCVHDLKEDIKTLHYASKEDDKRDDDHDGIPDVKQVRVCVCVCE